MKRPILLSLALATALATALAAAACNTRKQGEVIPTFAVAASLRNALPELQEAFRRAPGGGEVVATYGASGELKREVEAGAPIDGVLFAAGAPVDALVEAGLVTAASRKPVATNKLVLVGPRLPEKETPPRFETLPSLPAGSRIAVGDPRTVPVGQYARESLTRLGVWEKIQDRLVFGGDVAATLAYARRGEVAAAIVYSTDLEGISELTVYEEAKGDFAPHPEVVGGITQASAAKPRAAAFLRFLLSPQGQKILEKHGFGPPPE